MGNVVRAQVVLQSVSALPADVVCNTFHVVPADLTTAHLEAIAQGVRDFYTIVPTGETTLTVSQVLAKSVADTGHEVRIYTLDEATGARLAYEGAPPEWTESFDLLGRGTEALGMPNEVALCISLRNTTQTTVPKAQRTGRLYMGPIESAYGLTDNSGYAAPTVGVMNVLGHAAAQLKTDIAALGANWAVYSRPFAGRAEITAAARQAAGGPARALPALPARDGAAYGVDQVWVDDEFDTVRKRGRSAGARTVYAS